MHTFSHLVEKASSATDAEPKMSVSVSSEEVHVDHDRIEHWYYRVCQRMTSS